MRGVITIDLDNAQVCYTRDDERQTHPLASSEAFDLVSQAWLRCGWDCKHVYSFTWLGRPIVQLPEDMFRLQETIHRVKPDVIIDIGVAHGGSLVFHAGLCRLMNRGRVIGVDIDIRAQNRAAIQSHELGPLIALVEGDSTSAATLNQVRAQVKPGESVMVLLDGCHSYEHVYSELEAYSPMVTEGSYIVAMDGIMEGLAGAPRSEPDWAWNNPKRAAETFAAEHPEFIIEQLPFMFNEGLVRTPVTYWPGGYLKRVRS